MGPGDIVAERSRDIDFVYFGRPSVEMNRVPIDLAIAADHGGVEAIPARR